MRVLITGISGKLGRQVAQRLHASGHTVCGIDRRPWPDAPRSITVCRTDVRKRPAEEVFRTHQPHAVIHLSTVSHLAPKAAKEKYRINLNGTRAVFEYSESYGVQQVVFVGRHTYYGAASDAPLYHEEQDPPLAVSTFPELADLVAADLYASTALWRVPAIATAVLRLCYTLGPFLHGTLSAYLKGPRVPTVLGFDPLFQFMHESDAVTAVCLALEKKLRGIFNVAGPPPVPLSVLIRGTGRVNVRVPAIALPPLLGRLGLPELAAPALDHLKYPVVVDDRPFRAATGFAHLYDERQTIEAFRWS